MTPAPEWSVDALQFVLVAYLLLLPFARLGLSFNQHRKKALPGPLQGWLELYTNLFGLILWRVFSADHTNFLIRIYEAPATGGPRRLISNWSDLLGYHSRYNQVAEAITVTTLFTTLKYYPSNREIFRDRILRYARTVPRMADGLLVFEHVSVVKCPDRFDLVPAAEFTVDVERGYSRRSDARPHEIGACADRGLAGARRCASRQLRASQALTMCGIAGVFGRRDRETVDRMLEVLRHRGPDDGFVVDGEQFTLGARRLSIIDVVDGRQPIANETGNIWAAQNGELYNYSTVRQRLLAAGHRLHTRCDTEILPHLYEDYGCDLAPHIDGMFAIAVWDQRQHAGLLARDRMGKKPLYYYSAGECLYFASEIKALLCGPWIRSRDQPRSVASLPQSEARPASAHDLQGHLCDPSGASPRLRDRTAASNHALLGCELRRRARGRTHARRGSRRSDRRAAAAGCRAAADVRRTDRLFPERWSRLEPVDGSGRRECLGQNSRRSR